MTVEREAEPGVTFAICDGCGVRRALDLDELAEKEEVEEALEEIGFLRLPPEKVRFPGEGYYRATVHSFDQDFCADCRSDEPGPHPLFGSGRVAGVGASLDDPCDEWPRMVVWEALGLNPMCGHPKTPASFRPCFYCESGYPIGRVSAT